MATSKPPNPWNIFDPRFRILECTNLLEVLFYLGSSNLTIGGLFGNGQDIIPIRRGLDALDHPQPPNTVKINNTTSNSFVHSNIRKRRSKTWDMRWNWLRDKATHRKLKYYWAPGKENDADYFTKHFPPNYHKKIRPSYILKGFNLTTLHPYWGALALPSHVRGFFFHGPVQTVTKRL